MRETNFDLFWVAETELLSNHVHWEGEIFEWRQRHILNIDVEREGERIVIPIDFHFLISVPYEAYGATCSWVPRHFYVKFRLG